MSENNAATVDLQQIIKNHQANYAVFMAKTEKEVLRAIGDALKSSLLVTVYYSVTDTGLTLEHAIDPTAQKSHLDAPKHLDVTGGEIAKFFSEELIITTVKDARLPEKMLGIFQNAKCEQIAIIPVIQDVLTIGVIVAGETIEHPITEQSVNPLLKLAETIPVALNNVKASRATQQRLRELEAISEISQGITAASELKSIYEVLHKQILATIGETNLAIALYNYETNTLEIPYSYDGGQLTSLDPYPMGEGLISILIRTRQPLMLVEDTERRSRALGAKYVGAPAKSWLGCPLIAGGEAIGAIVIQDTEKEQRFNQDDLRFIIALSAQVAGAINNIRLLDETRRRALQLQTVAEISREVSSSLIVDNLLREAVQLVRERFSFYHAAIFLVDPSGEYAVIREATGEAGVQMKRSGHKLAIGSKSIVGYVTKNREPLVVNETTKDPNYFANPLLPDTKAEAALPLKVGDRVLGVVDVQSTRPYVFTDENIKIMQILADQLAVAVVNSELFAEAQERLSQHRLLHHVTTAAASSTTIEEALNSAVQGLQVTLGGDQISILLADKEQKMLEVKASIGYPNEESAKLKIPFGVGITGWVAARRQPLRIDDTTKDSRYIAVNPKVRSELAIPLIYRNEVLGVLNIESSRPGAYSESDEEMLGTLAGSLAAIIAHSRLLEQFRAQVERERQLYEITSKIRRTTSPEKILSIATEEITQILNTTRATIRISLDNPKDKRS